MASEQITGGKTRASAGDFITSTRREIGKVTWPTRGEVIRTTLAVVGFAVIAGVFFMLVDTGLGYLVSRLLGMTSH